MVAAPLPEFHYAYDVVDDPVTSVTLHTVALDWTAQGEAQPAEAGGSDAVIRDRIAYPCALVIVDNGAPMVKLEVSFTERVRSERRSFLVGSDASGSFSVRLEGDLSEAVFRLRFSYQPAPAATPEELLPPIEFLEAVAPSRELGLWSLRSGTWAVDPIPIPTDHPRLPGGYASTVSALARIQRVTGHSFAMPDVITEDDAASIGRADRLLSGSVVTGRWTHARHVLDPEGLLLIRSATEEHGALFELTSEFAVTIAGESVPLGLAEHRLLQVMLAGEEPATDGGGRMTIDLVPGPNDRFELRLVGEAKPWVLSEGRQRRRKLFEAAGLLFETDARSPGPPDPSHLEDARTQAGTGRPLAEFIIESRS